MRSRLYAEIRQAAPLTPAQEAAASLYRTAAVLMQPIAALLATHGLSPTQYNVLRILRGAGSSGLSCSAIAQRLVSPDPDTTRLLDRLMHRGWLRRDRDNSDRRIVTIRITPAGLRVLAACDDSVQKLQHTQFARLSVGRMRTLVEILETLRPVTS